MTERVCTLSCLRTSGPRSGRRAKGRMRSRQGQVWQQGGETALRTFPPCVVSLLRTRCDYKNIFNSFIFKCIYLFTAVLGLHRHTRAFSHCECKLLSSRGAWAQYLWHQGLLFRGMWDLPGPRLEPVSPALAGRLPITGSAGKS